ncbi:MAG: hypothetical protein U0269_19855 [Polyangiales bacterium]
MRYSRDLCGARRERRAAPLALALCLAPTPAFSQSSAESVRLAWVRDEGAEQCPDVVAVQRSVTSRVGHDPFRADAATSIDAVVRRLDGAFVARFFVRGPNGEALGNREFTSANERCEAIVEAVALALAIVIDPTVALRPTAQPATNSEAQPPVVQQPPRRRARPSQPSAAQPVAPTVARGPRVAAIGAFASALGLLPSLAAGASIEGEIHWAPWFSTHVSGAWFAEQRTRTTLSEFGFSFVGAHIAPCFDPLASAQDARASFALCAGLSVGATFAAVIGQRATDGGSRPWAAIVPSARGRLRIVGPLVLDARVGLALAAARASFIEELPAPAQPTLVFEQSVGSLFASLGLGIIH